MNAARAAVPDTLDEASRHDIYLSTHSDDACFSIGELARQRHAGTLLTVFSVSCYTSAKARRTTEEVRAITRSRMAEDALFAQACGLEPQWLGMPDALARGRAPFLSGAIPASAQALAAEVRELLVRALLGPTVGRRTEPRAWLFCPAAIGGHSDHVAVTMAVIGLLDVLAPHYRIAFYEDLYYASNPRLRRAGLEALNGLLRGRGLARFELALADDAAQSRKLALVHCYASQITPRISTIRAYTPATGEGAQPQEAAWLLQDDMHQRAG